MEDIREQILTYRLDAVYLGAAHYQAADLMERRHRWIGAPVVLLGAVLGTSIFATLGELPGQAWRIAAGLVSLLGAVLAAIQSFYHFDRRAQEHRAAGGAYASLRRSLDLLLLDIPHRERDELISRLDKFRTRFDEIAEATPLIPVVAYERARGQIQEEAASEQTSIGRIIREAGRASPPPE